jgi:hypothetical protein
MIPNRRPTLRKGATKFRSVVNKVTKSNIRFLQGLEERHGKVPGTHPWCGVPFLKGAGKPDVAHL